MKIVVWVVQMSDCIYGKHVGPWEIDEVFLSRAEARERAKQRRGECYATRVVKFVEEKCAN